MLLRLPLLHRLLLAAAMAVAAVAAGTSATILSSRRAASCGDTLAPLEDGVLCAAASPDLTGLVVGVALAVVLATAALLPRRTAG